MFHDINFKNKTAIITGGASGMGFLTAQNFAELGARVALVDISEEALAVKVDELKKAGYEALGCVCDVRHFDEVVNTCAKVNEAFGSIDVLVNCAGGAARRIHNCNEDFLNTPIEIYDWGIDVNLKGPFYFAKAAMKYMAEQKSGVVINLGSITGAEGCAANIDYSAAKAGVMGGMTKSLALFGASYGIRVCCVSPGPVLTRSAMASMKTLLGRAAEPQELVDMIIYLASDKAAFITGTDYLVDGGRLILRQKS